MVDFRSRSERDREVQKAATEDADYQRMYNQVLTENRALHGKLDQISASHGELQGQFADLLSQFEALKTSSQARSEDLLKIARNMEDMVATGYEQQGQLMDRFRSDIAGRLTGAKDSLIDLEDTP